MLLTGASGFVGSHILDTLREQRLPTAVLLRNTSDTRFVKAQLREAEVRAGSLSDETSLMRAIEDITHVIHCAGRTKALNIAEFYETNQLGTRNLVCALNKAGRSVERLVHISSLAASGPATAESPAVEDADPRPVSDYGKSKLAGEQEVRTQCRVPFTILRPPGVYGPRDTGFLSVFKAVKNHLLPQPNKAQALSLAYVKDLAQAIVGCMANPAAVGRTYFVASPEIVTGRGLAKEVAVQMKRWTIPCPIPSMILWLVCLWQQAFSQVTRRAQLLNLQKYAELRAPGWVCSPLKLQRETGLVCGTTLSQGVRETLEWYTREHWL